MRHITEGDLHAYLDGGLEAYPPGRADDIRRHLDTCAACRERLVGERDVIGRASEILAHAAPSSVAMPPFEELRSRALARDHDSEARSGSGEEVPSRFRLLRGGVWAATVVLALGLGWAGGRDSAGSDAPADPVSGAMDAPASSSEGPALEVASAPVEAPAEGRSPGREGGTEPEAAEPEGSGSSSRAGSPPAAAHPEPPAPAVAEAPSVERSGASLVDPGREPRRLAVLDRVPTLTDPGQPVRVDSIRGVAGGAPDTLDSLGAGWMGDPAAEDRRTAPERVASALAADRGVGLERERRRAGPERAEAPESLRPPPPLSRLAIPGVDVVSVEWVQVAPGVDGVRVVQRLVTGVTVELRFGGLATDDELPEYLLEESLADGVNQVHTVFERGWLVARARLEPEDIRSLVALIR